MGTQKKALEKAASKIREQKEELEPLREKVAKHERQETAEDIVLMKAAEGVIDWEDTFAERDQLVESGKDLQQMKVAMTEFGPGRTSLKTVEAEGPSAPTELPDKEAKNDEPEHIKKAREDFENTFQALGNEEDG